MFKINKVLKRLKMIEKKEIKNVETELTVSPKKEHIGLNVKITKTFHKMIKKQALEEDTTVADIVKKALITYLENKNT